MALVGTEVIVQNGGLLSRLGTFQLATLCQAFKIPFYAAAETHKLVRVYPLGQADLQRCGVRQHGFLQFHDGGDAAEVSETKMQTPGKDLVDYTVCVDFCLSI
jgi:translation initiation factor eIF-2B subunit alpha